MNEETPHSTPRFNQMVERFSKLNTRGRHYFIGRITSAAMEKPALRVEIERVLQRLETDSHLKRCWNAAGPRGPQAALPEEAAA